MISQVSAAGNAPYHPLGSDDLQAGACAGRQGQERGVEDALVLSQRGRGVASPLSPALTGGEWQQAWLFCPGWGGISLPTPSLGSERRFASSSSSRAAACCCGAAGLRAGGASWCSAQRTVRQTNLYGCLSAGPIKRQSSSHWPAAVQINLSTKRGHPRPSFLREILRGRGRGGWLELVVVGVFWLGQHQHQPGTWGTKHMPPVAGQWRAPAARPARARQSGRYPRARVTSLRFDTAGLHTCRWYGCTVRSWPGACGNLRRFNPPSPRSSPTKQLPSLLQLCFVQLSVSLSQPLVSSCQVIKTSCSCLTPWPCHPSTFVSPPRERHP